MEKRVVVTGMGIISPIGNDKKAYWDSLSCGRSGVAPIEGFDTAPFRTKVAAQVKGFEPKNHMSPQKIYVTDRITQFALVAAAEAIKDSKLEINDDNRRRIGVLCGTSEGAVHSREELYKDFYLKSARAVDPITFPRAMGVAVASNIAIEYGIKGVNYSYTNTCASGAVSVGEGYRLIKHGYADALITAGSEAPITPPMLSGWCKLRVLSTRNDCPEGAVRPFSKDRDGPVLGEGSGVIVLESLEHALKRSAHIYCEVAGYWAGSDAHHLTFPSIEGETDTIKGAINDAGISVDDIDYINAHGTATSQNDKGETMAIKAALGERAYSVPVSSIKSMVGHMLGAAGSAELIATILAIENQYLPPTINYEVPDPECDLDYVPNQGRKAEINTALSNSFGFGGVNSVIVVRKYK